MATITIARPSVASLYLVATAGVSDLASGTGFLVQRNGTTYLLTNWHNVTGCNPQTGTLLDSHGRRPESLRIYHNRHGHLGTWIEKLEPLYDNAGKRLWKEHPVLPGGRVDAVALPLNNLSDTAFEGYDPWAGGGPAVGASESVNIIGFPFGLTGGGYLAIWIRGAIASEPDIDYNDTPCFLVDARTRPGQSGSPVVFYTTGPYKDSEGTLVVQSGSAERLLGIYSGRVNKDSDLGFVWKVEALQAIIESGV